MLYINQIMLLLAPSLLIGLLLACELQIPVQTCMTYTKEVIFSSALVSLFASRITQKKTSKPIFTKFGGRWLISALKLYTKTRMYQDLVYNFKAEISGTGSRSEVV